MKCQVCGQDSGRKHIFKEMMFGSHDEFPYWECLGCGCIQITSIPDNLGDHYPENYYSFSLRSSIWRDWFYKAHFYAPGVMKYLRPCSPSFAAVLADSPHLGARILDVGAGNGSLVSILRTLGFDALGIEPFLKSELPYVRKSFLQDVEGGWDFIMFHHVLEHMPNQQEALCCARTKLNAEGTCLVRIPVVGWAWEHYERDWVQLDPPRHLMIHSAESFRRMAKSAGFRIRKTVFDSTDFQFWGSELNRRNVPFHARNSTEFFSRRDLRTLKLRANELNQEQQGDQAAFFLEMN